MLIHVDIELEISDNINPMSISREVIDSGIEKQVAEAILYTYERTIVENMKKEGWTKNGKKGRSIITKLGKIPMMIQRMKKGSFTYYPLLPEIGISGKEQYCADIKFDCADSAVKMTYRDADDETAKTRIRVPKSTIHSFVQKIGSAVGMKNAELAGRHDIVMGDGTKAHSMKKGKKNEINVVIGCNEGKEMIGLTVKSGKKNWEATGNASNRHITDDAVLVSDAEKAIRKCIENRHFQLDERHAITEVSYKLWQQKASKEERKEIIDELKRILYTLKSSVKKHTEDNDMKRIEWRMEKTLDDLKALAETSWKRGYDKVGDFIRKSANSMVTFARLLIKTGRMIPHSSNMIERLMGEIAKRIKNKWMHWSEKGLQNLLNMLLVRYCNRDRYKNIWKEYTNKKENDIKIDVKITMEGVKSTYFRT